MSLLPFLLDEFRPFRPSRILDQHFGVGLDPEDLLVPFNIPHASVSLRKAPGSYYRPWRSSAAERDGGSVVRMDKDKFQVNLDVQHFAPEEITVKVTGNNTVTIEGKQEEKQDEHGFISRNFVRKYVLPEGLDMEKLSSSLSSDGVLSITAPKVGAIEDGERTIPIQQTGVPSKTIESKKEDTPMEG